MNASPQKPSCFGIQFTEDPNLADEQRCVRSCFFENECRAETLTRCMGKKLKVIPACSHCRSKAECEKKYEEIQASRDATITRSLLPPERSKFYANGGADLGQQDGLSSLIPAVPPVQAPPSAPRAEEPPPPPPPPVPPVKEPTDSAASPNLPAAKVKLSDLLAASLTVDIPKHIFDDIGKSGVLLNALPAVQPAAQSIVQSIGYIESVDSETGAFTVVMNDGERVVVPRLRPALNEPEDEKTLILTIVSDFFVRDGGVPHDPMTDEVDVDKVFSMLLNGTTLDELRKNALAKPGKTNQRLLQAVLDGINCVTPLARKDGKLGLAK